uniref:Uncharacterized protein n=1 Tax=Rhizophora mucronata TaxID=61149 RepID=A0A2P2R2Z2_RHIMU
MCQSSIIWSTRNTRFPVTERERVKFFIVCTCEVTRACVCQCLYMDVMRRIVLSMMC